jgi:hypothetical protein
MLVLDSGGVSHLAIRNQYAGALIRELVALGNWPPLIPTPVLVECLQGDSATDTVTNRFLKICDLDDVISERIARRAAALRTASGAGSAVEALVVASAESGGTVVTGDVADLTALAAQARDVGIYAV